MQVPLKRITCLMLLILLSFISAMSSVQAEEQRDMQGWGIDDPYNKLYDVREFEKIRAWVVRVNLVPQTERNSIEKKCADHDKRCLG